MPRYDLWSRSVTRVEYDHRARQARLGLERIEQTMVKRPAAKAARPGWLLMLFRIAAHAEPPKGETTGSLSDQRPCRLLAFSSADELRGRGRSAARRNGPSHSGTGSLAA